MIIAIRHSARRFILWVLCKINAPIYSLSLGTCLYCGKHHTSQ